jgi:hypothetical protein
MWIKRMKIFFPSLVMLDEKNPESVEREMFRSGALQVCNCTGISMEFIGQGAHILLKFRVAMH